jgi:hypothetical protein
MQAPGATHLWMRQQVLMDAEAGLPSTAQLLQRGQENKIYASHCRISGSPLVTVVVVGGWVV